MENSLIPQYEVDARWNIVRANTAFCRLFRSTPAALVGRDVRELLRDDFATDFRRYVARVLVGLGDRDATFPMVAPCGEQAWLRHHIDQVFEDGTLSGYRASLQRLTAHATAAPKRWWHWRPVQAHQVWDVELDQAALAGTRL